MTRARDVANLIGSGNYSSTTFTATAGQTAFTISHTQGFIQVFMNGLLLDETVDYTSNGSAVTLTSGAAAGDEIEVVAYNTFSVGDALNQAAADTRYVNTTGDTMTGNLGVKATLKTTHADADVVQFGGTGYLANWEDAETYLAENLYVNSSGGYRYLTNSHASLYSQTTGKHQFKVAPSGSADGTPTLTTGLEIDNSGHVTMPNQPMFRIRTAGVSSVNGTGSGVNLAGSYYQSSTLVQAGSHFAVSTGRFTAPVAGYYFFNFSNRVDGVGSDYVYFTIFDGGGSIISRNLTSVNTTYQTLHCSAVWYMSANDYVYVRFNSASDSNVNLDSDGFFSGFLIG